jgi:hypothetical protein
MPAIDYSQMATGPGSRPQRTMAYTVESKGRTNQKAGVTAAKNQEAGVSYGAARTVNCRGNETVQIFSGNDTTGTGRPPQFRNKDVTKGIPVVTTMSGVAVQKPNHLVKKYRIGCAKAPINFSYDEKTFHVKDVPVDKLADKRNMKAVAKGNRLGLKQDHFNISTYADEKLCERRVRTIPDHDRPNMIPYNYRAEELPPKNPQHVYKAHKMDLKSTLMVEETHPNDGYVITETGIERVQQGVASRCKAMSINPRLEEKLKWENHGNWDESTYQEKNEAIARIEDDERKRIGNSKSMNNKLKNYKSPEERAKEERERLRLVKAGAVIAEEPAVDQTPYYQAQNRFAIEADRRYVKTKHTGVWEKNMDGEYHWSDTGSTVKDSAGDTATVVNPDSWNYASTRIYS